MCWLLTTEGTSLSSDRLQRVRGQVGALLKTQESQLCEQPGSVSFAKRVSIGMWCVFRPLEIDKEFLIGRIVSFSYLSGVGRSRQFSLKVAPTTPPTENARGLGCLCVWYCINESGRLVIVERNHQFYDLADYVCTIPCPSLCNGTYLKLHSDVINSIRKFL